MTFHIKLADKFIEIDALYPSSADYCREYLTDTIPDPDMKIRVQAGDIAYECSRSEAEDRKEGIPVRHFTDAYLETLAIYRKIADGMLAFDTVLFHGSVIAVDGIGYLFTARSGTGKSTHTRLWREHFDGRAVMINDDKPLLRITKEGVTAYGTPWDGKHRLSSNRAVPLKAICILKRDSVNHIEPVSGREIYPLLLQQIYRSADPAKMAKSLELLDRMLKNTAFYSLGCNMDPEAAVIAYEGMQGV